jgi:hypothetical protein
LEHPSERKDFINANHMDMCRFQDSKDDGYVKVRGVINKYIQEMQKNADQRRIGISNTASLAL